MVIISKNGLHNNASGEFGLVEPVIGIYNHGCNFKAMRSCPLDQGGSGAGVMLTLSASAAKYSRAPGAPGNSVIGGTLVYQHMAGPPGDFTSPSAGFP